MQVAQRLMLSDDIFVERVVAEITAGAGAEVALERIVTAMVEEFLELQKEYLPHFE